MAVAGEVAPAVAVGAVAGEGAAAAAAAAPPQNHGSVRSRDYAVGSVMLKKLSVHGTPATTFRLVSTMSVPAMPHVP